MPPELEFTPIPGMRMVKREEYERIMAAKSKARRSEILPATFAED